MAKLYDTYQGFLKGLIQLLPSTVGATVQNYPLYNIPTVLNFQKITPGGYAVTGTVDFTTISAFAGIVTISGVVDYFENRNAFVGTIVGIITGNVQFFASITIPAEQHHDCKKNRKLVADFQFLGGIGSTPATSYGVVGAAQAFVEKVKLYY